MITSTFVHRPPSKRAHLLASELPRDVWARVATSPHRLLLLDYDGTLAPFRVERSSATLPSSTWLALREAAGSERDRLVIVTGRPAIEVRRLIPDASLHIVGEHGWEDLAPDGALTQVALPPADQETLRLAAQILADRGWSDHVELKRCSVVLHTRGVAPAEAGGLESACALLWRPLSQEGRTTIEKTNGGLELRATAETKGTAVDRLRRTMPAGSLAVYVGDDASDEDAFARVRPDGITIRVGADDRPTAAEWRLGSPDDVTDFLRFWNALSRLASTDRD